jgi:MFS family permease
MKKAFEDYRYLAGGTGVSGSLWEGPDHLLFIEASGFLFAFSETYKRIDYAKVQTISVARTSTFGWMAAALSILVLLAGLIFASLLSRSGTAAATGAGVCLLVVLFVAILLIVHLVKGPTCVVKLQTAVQVVRLKPLKRLRSSQAVVARITDLCRLHQGQAAVPLESLGQTAPAQAFDQRGIKPPLPRSRLVMASVSMLAVAGALFAGEPFVAGTGYTIADFLVCIAAHLIAIIGLARLSRYELPGTLKTTFWGSGVNFFLMVVFVYGMLIAGSMMVAADAVRNIRPGADLGMQVNTNIFFWMANAGFKELSGFAWIFVGLGVVDVFLALLGMPALIQTLRQSKSGAGAAPPPLTPPSPPAPPAMVEPVAPPAPNEPPADLS